MRNHAKIVAGSLVGAIGINAVLFACSKTGTAGLEGSTGAQPETRTAAPVAAATPTDPAKREQMVSSSPSATDVPPVSSSTGAPTVTSSTDAHPGSDSGGATVAASGAGTTASGGPIPSGSVTTSGGPAASGGPTGAPGKPTPNDGAPTFKQSACSWTIVSKEYDDYVRVSKDLEPFAVTLDSKNVRFVIHYRQCK